MADRKTGEFEIKVGTKVIKRTREYILQCQEPGDISNITFRNRMTRFFQAHNLDLDKHPFLECFLHEDHQFLDEADEERMKDFGVKKERPRLCEFKHWTSIPEFPEIVIKVNVDYWKLTSKPLCHRNEMELDKDESEQEFSRLMTKLNLPDPETDSYIFNLPTPSLERYCLNPSGLMQSYHNLEQPSPLAANVTPSGLCVDLHHDTLTSVDTLFGPPKIWLFYPPSPHNLSVLSERYGHNNRLKACFQKLKGGVVFEQKHGQTLVLPSYIPHATFSIGSNILVGWTMETVEFFPRRLINFPVDRSHIKVENVGEDKRMIEEHLERLLEDLERALKEEAPLNKPPTIKDYWRDNKGEILWHLNGSLRTKAMEIWEPNLSESDSGVMECPLCDRTDVRNEEFPDHWKDHRKAWKGDRAQRSGPYSGRPGKRSQDDGGVNVPRTRAA